MIDWVLVGVLLLVVGRIAYTDARLHLIRNSTLVKAAPVALGSSLLFSGAVRDVVVWDAGHPVLSQGLDALIAAGVGLLLFGSLALVLARTGRQTVGMGDVKYVGVLGLWLGVADLAYAFGLAVVAGGFAALLLVLARRLRQDEEIPFGSFLSAGAGLAVLT